MRNIYNLIGKLGKFILKNIEESRPILDESDKSFSITTIDNYDFYEFSKRYVHRKNVFEPETTDEEIYSKTCIRTYRRAFKFLQLLCENNNKYMKEYIQNQEDEDGRVKYTSINFIEEANKTLEEVMDILKSNLKEIRSFSDNMPKDIVLKDSE